MGRTPYAETEFLLAVMEENTDEIYRLVSDMSPGEIKTLYGQLGTARTHLAVELQIKTRGSEWPGR